MYEQKGSNMYQIITVKEFKEFDKLYPKWGREHTNQ
jgi:hypothetical protein